MAQRRMQLYLHSVRRAACAAHLSATTQTALLVGAATTTQVSGGLTPHMQESIAEMVDVLPVPAGT